jgi:GTPase SAR1 family protein
LSRQYGDFASYRCLRRHGRYARHPPGAIQGSLLIPSGSGKTTFVQRINNYLHTKKQRPYVLNLDPAVLSVPFEPNIDIRDSINYKEVMKQYNLGPNGGILTSLNLFATKIDQILGLMERRSKPAPDSTLQPPKHFLVDTPGQIEVFVWSASGSILLESFASSFPTVIAYIIDTPRTSRTSTFMSNMLYACSILYKTKLPMILVFNKTDVQDAEFAREWMTDFEKFQDALREEEEKGVFGGEGFGGGSGYMSSLLNSMSLMLEEFYNHLDMVAVSSMTGDGIDEFFEAVEKKRQEFERDYRPELERKRAEREKDKAGRTEEQLTKVMQDMKMDAARKKGRQIDDDDDDNPKDDGEDDNDPDDYPDEEPHERESLNARYQQALKDAAPGGAADEQSFARYLTSSQANR